MRRAAIAIAIAAVLSANAATVRTATEDFVTNKIAAAVAALPAPDYSTNNTELVETIQAKAPAPGNYAVVSNAAMNAVQTETDPTIYAWAKAASKPPYTADEVGALPLAGGVLNHLHATNYVAVADSGELSLLENMIAIFPKCIFAKQGDNRWQFFLPSHRAEPNATLINSLAVLSDISTATNAVPGTVSNVVTKAYVESLGISSEEVDPTVPAWAKAQTKPTYTASEVGATTPADVTAAIREQSLGGIWDAELEVWWTPRMRNGNLTYEATTNVNLNAVN